MASFNTGCSKSQVIDFSEKSFKVTTRRPSDGKVVTYHIPKKYAQFKQLADFEEPQLFCMSWYANKIGVA